MKDLEEHKKIAVLIDADNAQKSKLQSILSELSTHGHIVVKRAYGDWSINNLKNWKESLNELAIQPIQQFAYTTGKNSTDASMIIDTMDLLYTGNFDAFALVSSDSDFTKLASRLRESEMFVFGVGEKKTPISFRNACDNFIFTENLNVMELEPVIENLKTNKKNAKSAKQQSPESKLVKLFYSAWEQYADDEGWANVAAVGALLKRLHPDFDPRNFGCKNIPELLKNKLNRDFSVDKFKGKNNATIVAYTPKDV